MGSSSRPPDEFAVGGDLLEWLRLGMECRLAKPCCPVVLYYLGSDQSAADGFQFATHWPVRRSLYCASLSAKKVGSAVSIL